MKMELFHVLSFICWIWHTLCMSLDSSTTCGTLIGTIDGTRYRIALQPSKFLEQNMGVSVRWFMEPNIIIGKRNKLFSIVEDKKTLYILVLNASTYTTYFVDCFLTNQVAYYGSNRLAVNQSVLVSTKTTTFDVDDAITQSRTTDGNTTPRNTTHSTIDKVQTTVDNAIGTSEALTTKSEPSRTNRLTRHTTGVTDESTNTTPTTKSQPITNDANIHITDQGVLNPSAENDRLQIVIIAVVCAVLMLIAVIVAVLCVKRRRRPVVNEPVQDTTRLEQVAQEEGYASMGGAECQYAVVNKPKKLSAPQANQAPPVENKPIEMQSQPKKPIGAGELIYADLDKEALTATPSNAKPTGTLERPSTPTEYVGIDFARTVALENANKQDE